MKEFPFDPYDFFGYIANGLLIVVGLELIVGVPNVLGKDLKAFDMVALSMAVYVAGQVIASPAKWILESIIIKKILNPPSINLMAKKDNKPIFWIIFPGYFETLPESIKGKIIEKAKLEGLTETSGEDLFLHIRYREYLLSDQNLMSRMNSFLNKYGFNRNLCFTSLIFGFSILIFADFDIASDITRYGLLFIFASILMFYRYLKFFRLYSFELFNTYAGK